MRKTTTRQIRETKNYLAKVCRALTCGHLTHIPAHLVAGLLQNQSGNLNGDIDENALLQSHDKVNNQGGNVGSGDIGNAAALSAIKSVLGGSGGNGGGGDMQQKLIGAAMAHAGSVGRGALSEIIFTSCLAAL